MGLEQVWVELAKGERSRPEPTRQRRVPRPLILLLTAQPWPPAQRPMRQPAQPVSGAPCHDLRGCGDGATFARPVRPPRVSPRAPTQARARAPAATGDATRPEPQPELGPERPARCHRISAARAREPCWLT